MENSEKNHLVTKTSHVRKHLIEHRHITSWEAINLYGATRLSAIIFNLRRRGMNIYSQSKLTKDRNGNNCNFVKYVLIQD
jgi:hypothetical protein